MRANHGWSRVRVCANWRGPRLRVLESDADAAANDISERGNARDSDFVAIETVSEGWDRDGERERERGVSQRANANTIGWRRTSGW